MNDNVWYNIQEKYRNSVVQIVAIVGAFNIIEPYNIPQTKEGRGSGFLISKEGHIITNAHVVGSMVSMVFRCEGAGNKNLTADLIGICHTKDVALLKVTPEALPEIGPFEPFNFGDDNELVQTEEVVAIGYPLGRERIKFTKGVISGYESTCEDSGCQSFIQIDASINHGSSGGPLVRYDGKVIGVNSAGVPSNLAQNTNFAIPSRVVLSILRELFSREGTDNPLVVQPTMGLEFQKVTIHSFLVAGVKDSNYHTGLRVKGLEIGSPFVTDSDGDVKIGDIIQEIEYADPYNDADAFDVENYKINVCKTCRNRPDTLIRISRIGDVKLYKITKDDELTTHSITRKLSLNEILDTIPIDTLLTLKVLRPSANPNNNMGEITAPFRNHTLPAIKKLYPPYDKLDYVIFGGGVWIPLSANIMDVVGQTKYLCDYLNNEQRNEPRIMLSKILPNNDLRDIDCCEVTEILLSVNDVEVFTLDDLRKALLRNGKYVTLKTNGNNEIILDMQRANMQDKEIHERLSIRPTKFSLQLWSI